MKHVGDNNKFVICKYVTFFVLFDKTNIHGKNVFHNFRLVSS